MSAPNLLMAELSSLLKSAREGTDSLTVVEAYERFKGLLKELEAIGDLIFSVAVTDHLTGLPNERALDGDLKQIVDEAVRLGRPVAAMEIDINDFKVRNKFKGKLDHAAGNIILQTVADTFYESTQGKNIGFTYRKHGDEFAIILPNMAITEALEFGEILADRIRFRTVSYLGEVLPPVTVAMGVGALPDHGSSLRELMGAAAWGLAVSKAYGEVRAMPPELAGELLGALVLE